MVDQEEIEPTLLDTIVFLRSGVKTCYFVGKQKHCTITLVITKRGAAYLKFNYPGNIQYHLVDHGLLERAMALMSLVPAESKH